jgi:hypothetical protein
VLVVNDVVNVMAAFQLYDIDYSIHAEHNRIIIVVLAKHEVATWWWFLREPKHVGAIVGILIVFNIPTTL